MAGGNLPGDAEMLQFDMSYEGPSRALIVNHDDGHRECSYASKAGTFETEETVLETAARAGWVVASINDDWATVFADS